jgi:hypothetical protein
MSPITITGVKYLHVKEAARHAALSPDYVARLCRRGEIEDIKIDRAWHVSERSLKDFLVTHHSRRALWRGDIAHIRRTEYRRARVAAARWRDNAVTVVAPTALWRAQRTMQIVGGAYAIAPGLEFLHKLSVTVVVVALVIGTGLVFRPDVRASARASLSAAAGSVLPRVEGALHDLLRDLHIENYE